jgi:hypothetical protein
MAELKDEWEFPISTHTEPVLGSWALRDTSAADSPWAWITLGTNDTQYHLERWTGRTWEPHAVFDTLEDAKAVGRIVAGIDMRRLQE